MQIPANEIGYVLADVCQGDPAPEEVAIHPLASAGRDRTGHRLREPDQRRRGANGIENEFVGAEIAGNEIVGNLRKGSRCPAPTSAAPNAITGNTVIKAGGSGILIIYNLMRRQVAWQR